MKFFLLSLVSKTIFFFLNNKVGSYIIDDLFTHINKKTYNVKIKDDLKIKIATPNRLCLYRAKTFFTKEPDTILWLNEMDSNSIFWDIGANVGLYSLYASLLRDCRTYAFEPSVFNLDLLAKNTFLNELNEKVTIIPLALNDTNGSNSFNLSNLERGGALSSFSKSFDQNGKQMDVEFKYSILGVTGDFMLEKLNFPQPDYIKIDVDGIEHLILKGLINLLPNVKSILLEISDDFKIQAELSNKLLTIAGFRLFKKTVTSPELNQFNQWWIKIKK